MSRHRYHARQAALALLNMAKSTSDASVAAALVGLAAELKEQAGDLPPPVSQQAPGVEPVATQESAPSPDNASGTLP